MHVAPLHQVDIIFFEWLAWQFSFLGSSRLIGMYHSHIYGHITLFSLNLRLVECCIKNIIHCGQHDIPVGFQSGKLSHALQHMNLSQCHSLFVSSLTVRYLGIHYCADILQCFSADKM